MTWARLDDTFHHHPKLMQVDLAAVGLFALGLSYAADNLTDGRLPERWVLGRMVGDEKTAPNQLVAVGLWEQVPGGYVIHDFDDYNLTRDQVEERRRRDSERKQSGIQTEDARASARKPGTGKGSGKETFRGNKNGLSPSRVVAREFDEWIEHFRQVTGRTEVRGSKAAQDQFRARRGERSLDELKLATVGCHSDAFCREHGHDVPETILRASKVERYVELGRGVKAEPQEAVF